MKVNGVWSGECYYENEKWNCRCRPETSGKFCEIVSFSAKINVTLETLKYRDDVLNQIKQRDSLCYDKSIILNLQQTVKLVMAHCGAKIVNLTNGYSVEQILLKYYKYNSSFKQNQNHYLLLWL